MSRDRPAEVRIFQLCAEVARVFTKPDSPLDQISHDASKPSCHGWVARDRQHDFLEPPRERVDHVSGELLVTHLPLDDSGIQEKGDHAISTK